MTMFQTPSKNEDLRHIATGLTPDEQRQASEEGSRLRMLEILGDKWLLHPSRRQEKGVYCVRTGRRLG
jgi:hypothetical protein